MFIASEGTIEIPLEQLQEWIIRCNPQLNKSNLTLGVPRVNASNITLEIDFVSSFGDDPTHPSEWAETPKVLKQWEGLG
jgi:hypothetical protein